jgi:glucokinase
MSVLGIDLGGTKLAAALFDREGAILHREVKSIDKRTGSEAGKLITDLIGDLVAVSGPGGEVTSIGISVPGISYAATGRVWAPNIQGWTDYPLMDEVKSVAGTIPVVIDSDRACYILGEVWKGNAVGCSDAIFLGVGTGIGAGIMINNEVLRGKHDIAGAIGWMALDRPFREKYVGYGCFEYNASGEGLAKIAREFIQEDKGYNGILKNMPADMITAHEVFRAFDVKDGIAVKVINRCVEYWGMAAANLISLFNPEKIIFGGGVFGPARKLVPSIRKEASKWAQPVGINQVAFDVSALEGDAGIYGAGYLALRKTEL